LDNIGVFNDARDLFGLYYSW